jgi:hypothetical protein
MRKWIDRAVNVYEFFLAYLFLKGAWDVYHAKAVVSGSIYDHLTNRFSIVLYAILLGVLGVALIVSKIFKHRRTHGYTLMGMYLLAFYIVSLSLAAVGWDDGLILSIFYTLSIGAVYLYWRYRVVHEQLDHKIESE